MHYPPNKHPKQVKGTADLIINKLIIFNAF
jgi:hypothetical protein